MSTTQGDIERGLKFKTPSRMLLNEISQMAAKVANEPQVIPGKAKEILVELAERVAARDRKVNQKI